MGNKTLFERLRIQGLPPVADKHQYVGKEEKDRLRAEKEEDEKRWAAARRKQPMYESSSSERPFSDQDFLPLSGSSAPADAELFSASSEVSPQAVMP